MTGPWIVPIVEGHGEVEAVPLLIRRIFSQFRPSLTPKINPPSRIKSGAFLHDDTYFAKYVSLACAKAAQGRGTVLILLDSEDQCPARLGPSLLEKARSIRGDVPLVVALAYREFETWFIASANSLAGKGGMAIDAETPRDPESIRGAKEWLAGRTDGPYDPIVHQSRFCRIFDLMQARSVPSFDRLVNTLIRLDTQS